MKVRNILFKVILLVILILASCSRPNTEDILRKSIEKCQSIENGYYEMTHYMKYMSNKDTSSSSLNGYFSRLPDDSIYYSAFHYQRYSKGVYLRDVMYTGDDFVDYSKKDSTGEIISKKRWAKDIKAFSHNLTFYTPITNKGAYPLPKYDAFVDKKYVFELVGEENINSIPCYHIRMNKIPENDSTDMMKKIRIENNYWISKQDYIPIQYAIAIDVVMNNDTMYQYEKNVLTKYELNNLKDEEPLKLSSIPSYVNLKDYIPYEFPELLPNNTLAPNWSLVSLNDKTVKLSDFKGQLVLIDFFYKSCYPCILSLPALKELHKRYKDKGLQVVGINPYDTKEKDDIDDFLSKRGVNYFVLLGGKEVAKEYNVSGYPTIYLIDKEGRILYSHVGYTKEKEKKLEEIIKQNL